MLNPLILRNDSLEFGVIPLQDELRSTSRILPGRIDRRAVCSAPSSSKETHLLFFRVLFCFICMPVGLDDRRLVFMTDPAWSSNDFVGVAFAGRGFIPIDLWHGHVKPFQRIVAARARCLRAHQKYTASTKEQHVVVRVSIRGKRQRRRGSEILVVCYRRSQITTSARPACGRCPYLLAKRWRSG